MNKTNQYIMYGAPVSLYSGKVRSYLRKKSIPYTERLTCHPEYLSDIFPAVGRMVIPVVKSPQGDIIQDTSEIIDYLELQHSELSKYPTSPTQRVLSLLFELFGDEGLLRQAMHYRWNFQKENDEFISLEFGRFMDPHATDEEAKSLAAMPKSKMSGYLPALGITDASAHVIELGYLELLKALDTHFLKYPYLFGGTPSIGDFGLYAPLYAHLGRDPVPSMIMKQQANRVWRWVERMTAPDADMPEFPNMEHSYLTGDYVPDTLIDILKVIKKDYLPEIEGLVKFINQHLKNNPDITEGVAVLPKGSRSLGFFNVNIRSTEISVAARHYSIYMLQRVQDAYDTLSPVDKHTVKTCLKSAKLESILTLRTSRRIERVNYKEVWGTTQ